MRPMGCDTNREVGNAPTRDLDPETSQLCKWPAFNLPEREGLPRLVFVVVVAVFLNKIL